MDASTATRLSERTRRRQWTMVALLVLAGTVNYVDRSTLSIASTTIEGEMHLSHTAMGILLGGAFAWAYALAQLPVGVLTDRVGPHIMLSAAMAVWSVAQFASGFVVNFGQFFVARVGLGLGESPMFTAGARACVDWFPLRERGLPLGLFNSASSLGPALAPLLLTGVMTQIGWRPMLVIMGIAGLAVALAWWLYYRAPEKAQVPPADLAAIRAGDIQAPVVANPHLWASLFAIPSTWAMMGGLFGIVYVTWLCVSWMPNYLETVHHVPIGVWTTGVLSAIPQIAGVVGGILGGLVSDRLAQGGLDPIDARKVPTVATLVIAGLFTATVPLAPDTYWAVTLLSAAMFFAYASGSCSWALGASLTPPHLVATLESIQNIGGSIGGGLAPIVTGLIIDRTGSFNLAFVVAAVACVGSAISYAIVRNRAYDNIGAAGGLDGAKAAG